MDFEGVHAHANLTANQTAAAAIVAVTWVPSMKSAIEGFLYARVSLPLYLCR